MSGHRPGVEFHTSNGIGFRIDFQFANGWTVEVFMDQLAKRTHPTGKLGRFEKPKDWRFVMSAPWVRTRAPEGSPLRALQDLPDFEDPLGDDAEELTPEELAAHLAKVAAYTAEDAEA
jgi:hypothetical protein